jgi:hypothetical protein
VLPWLRKAPIVRQIRIEMVDEFGFVLPKIRISTHVQSSKFFGCMQAKVPCRFGNKQILATPLTSSPVPVAARQVRRRPAR